MPHSCICSCAVPVLAAAAGSVVLQRSDESVDEKPRNEARGADTHTHTPGAYAAALLILLSMSLNWTTEWMECFVSTTGNFSADVPKDAVQRGTAVEPGRAAGRVSRSPLVLR